MKLILLVAIGLCCHSLGANAAGLDFTLLAVRDHDDKCDIVIEVYNGSELNLTKVTGHVYARDKDYTVAEGEIFINPRIKQGASIQFSEKMDVNCATIYKAVLDVTILNIDG